MRTCDIINMSLKSFYVDMILGEAISTQIPMHHICIGLVAFEKSEHTHRDMYMCLMKYVLFLFPDEL